MRPDFESFCSTVCSVVRTKRLHAALSTELSAHLEDCAAALTQNGLTPEDASAQALTAMGDPYEIGHGLDRCYSPHLPRLSRVLAALAAAVWMCALFIGFISGSNLQHIFHPIDFAGLPGLPSTAIAATVTGGGKVGLYTLAPDAAYLVPPAEIGQPHDLWVYYTFTHPLWLDAPADSHWPATCVDDKGFSYEDSAAFPPARPSLLQSQGVSFIMSLNSGARSFTLMLGPPEQCVRLYVTLPEEVPSP